MRFVMSVLITLLLIGTATAKQPKWVKYYNKESLNFYYDENNIYYPEQNVTAVWIGHDGITQSRLFEINCKNRTFKFAFMIGGNIVYDSPDGNIIPPETNHIDALHEAVCKP